MPRFLLSERGQSASTIRVAKPTSRSCVIRYLPAALSYGLRISPGGIPAIGLKPAVGDLGPQLRHGVIVRIAGALERELESQVLARHVPRGFQQFVRLPPGVDGAS